MSNPCIIVQARMGSTRFPGKVLAPLCGQPMLLWQLDRVSRVTAQHTMVVACPNTSENDAIATLCDTHGYHCQRVDGDERDVLHRYWTVAHTWKATQVIRLTADCPLLDPQVITQLINAYWDAPSRMAYMGIGDPSYWPDGQDVEIMDLDALDAAYNEATLPSDREHVTSYIRRNHARFPQASVPCPFDCASQGYSVDTPEDLTLVTVLLEKCLAKYGPAFGWREIDAVLRTDRCARRLHAARPPRNHAYLTQVAREQEKDHACGTDASL